MIKLVLINVIAARVKYTKKKIRNGQCLPFVPLHLGKPLDVREPGISMPISSTHQHAPCRRWHCTGSNAPSPLQRGIKSSERPLLISRCNSQKVKFRPETTEVLLINNCKLTRSQTKTSPRKQGSASINWLTSLCGRRSKGKEKRTD